MAYLRISNLRVGDGVYVGAYGDEVYRARIVDSDLGVVITPVDDYVSMVNVAVRKRGMCSFSAIVPILSGNTSTLHIVRKPDIAYSGSVYTPCDEILELERWVNKPQ
jgi:hypothetical protein